MSGIKAAMQEFVAGELDFAGLEMALATGAAKGESREDALDALDALTVNESLSPAVAGLLRRAIVRHFAMDDTDPFHDIRPPEQRMPVVDMGEADETDPELPVIYPKAPDEPEPSLEAPAAEEAAPPPEPGTIIAGRYELEGLIGRGGAGLVYRAVDRLRQAAGADEPRVALKILKPELAQLEEAKRRLLAEGVRGTELRHENLVRVIDVGEDDDLGFVTMELLEGGSLRGVVLQNSPEGLPADEALRILAGVARGLSCLHEKGLVHGDLKPGNVFLTREGVPKLLDFGTAVPGRHDREPTLTAAAPPGRTPAYASPEALTGEKLKFSDDIYSLGCLACELLSSKHPFDRTQSDEARDKRMRPTLPRSVSGKQRRTLAAALQFSGERRPRDAKAFVDEMGLETGDRKAGGVLLGALGGLAVGILLVLAIINPEGPLGRFLPADSHEPSQPAGTAEEPAVTDGADAAQADSAPRTAAVDAAGGFVPAETGPEPPQTVVVETEPVAEDERAEESTVSLPPETGPDAETVTEPVSEPEPEPAVTPAKAKDDLPTAQESAVVRPPVPGQLSFALDEYRVEEGTAVVIATIRREQGSDGDVTVRWRTVADSAEADVDFVASDWEQVTIADGEEEARVYIPLVDDGLVENEESFFLELSRPGGGAVLGSPARVRVRIGDDESPR